MAYECDRSSTCPIQDGDTDDRFVDLRVPNTLPPLPPPFRTLRSTRATKWTADRPLSGWRHHPVNIRQKCGVQPGSWKSQWQGFPSHWSPCAGVLIVTSSLRGFTKDCDTTCLRDEHAKVHKEGIPPIFSKESQRSRGRGASGHRDLKYPNASARATGSTRSVVCSSRMMNGKST